MKKLKSVTLHILKRFGIFLFVCIIFSVLFKKIYEPYDRISIAGSDSDWLIIIFNFIVIFFFFLLIEAFRFNSEEKKYQYANLGMLLVLVLFVIVVFNS